MTTYASDTFTRSATDQWGTADTGGAWTVEGTAADFDVNGTAGTMVCGSSTTRTTRLASMTTAQDVEARCDFTFNTAVTAGTSIGAQWGFEIRRSNPQATANAYRLRFAACQSGTDARLRLNTVLSGSEANVATQTLPGVDWSAQNGTVFHCRVQVVQTSATASTIKFKYWLGAASEPTSWNWTVSDSTSALQNVSGTVGLTALTGSTVTETFSFDNFSVSDPATDSNVTVDPAVLTPVVPVPNTGGTITYLASDSFTRTTNPGWGTADTGGAWTTPSFSSNTRNTTDGTYAVMTGAASAIQGASLASVSQADTEVSCQFSVPTVVTGATGPSVGVYMRTNSAMTTYLRVRVTMPAAGGFTITGHTVSGGASPVNLGSAYVGSASLNVVGQVICMKAQVRGSSSCQVRAKVWILGDTEPDWQFIPLPYTTGPTSAGGVGIYSNFPSDYGPAGTTIRADNFLAYAYPNVPPVPTVNAVAPAPTVSVIDAFTTYPKIVTPLSQIQFLRDQVAAGRALGGDGNKWSRMYAYWDRNSFGYQSSKEGGKVGQTSDQTRYFSKTYQFNPTNYVNSTSLYNNFIDDMSAALMLIRRGVVETDSTCYTAAKTGLMSWVTGANRALWFHSLSADESGKLYFHWGFTRMTQAVSLLIELGQLSSTEIIAFRGWLKAVPFRGSLDYTSFVPNRVANPATKEAESTLMSWNATGNWLTGICVGLLDAALLTDGTEGDALLTYAQRYFEHVFKSNVWHSGNTYRCASGSVISDPNWVIDSSPSLESSPIQSLFTPADNAAHSWGFNTHTAAAAGMFDGQTMDYCRDQGHDAMTMSHIARYVLTYLYNVGDPFVNISWAWDALANGIEERCAVLNEFYDAGWTAPYNGDLNALDATTWTPTGTFSGWNWSTLGFGWYDTNGPTNRGGPTFILQDGKNGVGGYAAIWRYILVVLRGYTLPQLERFVTRNADIPTASVPRGSNGPAAGIAPSSTPYSMDYWNVVFATDSNFTPTAVVTPKEPPVPTVNQNLNTAIAPNPTILAVPVTQFTLGSQRLPVTTVVAPVPAVQVTSDVGNPSNTNSASPPTTTLNEKGFGATYTLNKRKGFR